MNACGGGTGWVSAATGTVGASSRNYGFSAQSGWTDTVTGEINTAARWYQPGIGHGAPVRWILLPRNRMFA